MASQAATAAGTEPTIEVDPVVVCFTVLLAIQLYLANRRVTRPQLENAGEDSYAESGYVI